jgi:hypothetical protein
MTDPDLVGRLEDPPAPRSTVQPRSPDDEPVLARSNMVLALLLWGLSVTLFAGTFLIALAYLLLD